MSSNKSQIDLLKRKLQIEASLDRIRDLTMKMKDSGELSSVIQVVFREAISLGFGAKACDLVIFDKKTGGAEFWISGDLNDEVIYARIPRLRIKHYDDSLSAWKRRKKLRSVELKGKSCQAYMRQIIEKMEDSNMPESIKELLLNLGSIYHTEAFTKHGLFRVASDGPLKKEEEDILKRFAKVFEQTYTRFLDLQKAEAQAREAQIEAALERVRARTMAMHRSEELVEVATVLHNELRSLNVREFSETSIVVHDEPGQKLVVWGAQTGSGSLEKSVFPLLGDQILQKLYDTWRRQEDFFTLKVEGAALRKHIDFVFPKASRTELENEAIKRMPDPTFFHCAFYCMGYLELMSDKDLSEDSSSLLVRFARVFDQAYTRYLDLQQAEAQAREAQIEAALERVRTRSMAMHNSDELQEVIKVVFDQIKVLGLVMDSAQFDIFEEGSNDSNGWIATKEYQYAERIKTPYFKSPVIDTYLKAKRKKPSTYNMSFSKSEKDKYWKHVFKNTDLSKIPSKRKKYLISSKGLDQAGAILNDLSLSINNYQGISYSEDDTAIIRRFAEVFQQTYTRFLDLQKAEAQAREAQIEVALERVRARTMAMHKGEELAETALLLFEQITELGIKPRSCGFLIMDEESESMQDWSANVDEKGKATIVTGTLAFDQHPLIANVVATWRKGEPYFIGELHGSELHEYYKAVTSQESTSKDIKDKVLAKAKSEVTNSFYFEYGMMYVLTPHAMAEHEIGIMQRFASVFEQTYTRFLDLEKAEAQAREAQIETALERVRARSISMQLSTELNEVAVLLHREMRTLGTTQFLSCGYVEVIEPEKMQRTWMTNLEGGETEEAALPLTGDPVVDVRYRAWKKQEPLFQQTVMDKALSTHFEFAIPFFGSEEREIMVRTKFPSAVTFYCANFPHGYLHILSGTKLTTEEEDLLVRFTKVFEQTYTRFLDLQKAEAQAKEAQIEAALERIRSRSMAMHESNELREVIASVFEQLQNLEFVVPACSLIFYQEDMSAQHWFAGYSHDIYPESYTIPFIDIPYYTDMLEAWKNHKEYGEFIMKGKAKVDYAKWLLSESDFKKLPKEFVEQSGMLTPTPMYFADAFNKYGMIEVIGNETMPENKAEVLKRISKVFEQTYTRFLDLQKAEAQAREAQIEASLEKVRGTSMAMHKSEDLIHVANVMNQEFEKLGFTNSLQASFVLIDEEKKVQYLWGAQTDSHLLDFVTLPLFGDDVLQERYDAWKRKEAFLSVALTGEKRKMHVEVAMPLESLSKRQKKGREAIPDPFHICCGFTKYGYLTIISSDALADDQQRILARMAKVFEQTYTRFLDLQKAEAQAREAQIETALETVRAKAMAMRVPDDLKSVAIEVRRQIDGLGQIDVEAAVVHLYEKGSPNFESLAAILDPSGTIITFHSFFPVNSIRETQQMMANYWAGKKEYTIELTRKKARQWQQIVFEKNPEQGSHREEFINDLIQPDQAEYWNFADYSGGSLLLVTHAPLTTKSKDLLRRSANVFDLAYRRYQDLVIAEAQALEAQIEAALERVRSKMMAMHKSDELREVISMVFMQLGELGFDAPGINLIVFDENHAMEHWMSGFSYDLYPRSYKIPYNDHPYFVDIFKAWKAQVPFQEFFFEGKLKLEYAEWALENSDFKHMPKEFKEEMKDQARLILSNAFNKYGMLEIMDPESLKQNEIEVLIRFSTVFEQTYSRFLDLQKAEAQAREAEIELALERVRARAMAMHKSEEIAQVAATLFQQFTDLGVHDLRRCVIWTLNTKQNGFQCWYTTEEGESYANSFSLPLKGNATVEKLYKTWKSRRSESFELRGKSYKDWGKFIRKHGWKYPKGEKPASLMILNEFPFEYGLVEVATYSELREADHNLAARFTKAFELTYTRFLDLQNAEAQAREARIEAALERVRSQTMAMQKSEDLAGTVSEIFKQLLDLGVGTDNLRTCGISTFHDSKVLGEVWITETTGKILKDSFTLRYDEAPAYKTIYREWKRGERYSVLHLHGKAFHEHMSFVKKYAGNVVDIELKEIKEKYNQIFFHVIYFSKGYLFIITYDPIDDYEDILRRFGAVFQQTYTRFLDLKKAEAQAHEAQIEAALERVRARSMAMHNSNELKEVAAMMYEQMEPLGFAKHGCEIILCDEENDQLQFWSTNAKQTLLPERYDVDRSSHPFFRKQWKAWKQKQDRLVITNEGKEKRDFDNFLFTKTDFRKFPEHVKKFILSGKKDVFTHAIMKFGLLEAVDEAALSEEKFQVLKRFAKVFQQTYTRFLDLQRAEAQAREAQIEAALERVRSRSMAMHKSDELQDVVNKVLEQLKELHVEVNSTSIFIFREGSKDWEQWVSTSTTSYSTFFHVPYADYQIFRDLEEARQSGVDFFAKRYSNKEKNDWFEHACSSSNYSQIPTARKKFIRESECIILSFALAKNTCLQVAKYSGDLFSLQENEILRRFSNVFEQAYVRFLDLQKAEVQARESQIEAALERVRARALAMHDSKELGDVVQVIREQMALLGQAQLETIAIHLYPKEGNDFESWYAIRSAHKKKGEVLTGTTRFSKKDTAIARKMLSLYHSDKSEYKMEPQGKILDEWQEMAIDRIPGMEKEYGDNLPTYQYWYFADFSGGSFVLIPREEPNEEAKELLKRSASVFDLAYRRYLDLKKAEKQAREGQIEAALERVRSRTMAMHQSNEIAEILGKIFEELTSLDIELTRCIIWTFNEENQTVSWWLANPEAKSGAESFDMEFNDHPVFQDHVKAWKEKKPVWQYKLSGKRKTTWDDTIFNESDLSGLPSKVKKAMRGPETIYFTGTCKDFGILRTVSLEPVSEENVDIIQRFGRVLQQSFTRFGDVQKAEKQAREAIKQSSLDRVRAEIASMRTADDLNRITPLVWSELTTLGVPFFRCGVFIVDETSQYVRTFLSTPTGDSLAAIDMKFGSNALMTATVENWRKNKVHREVWDKADFTEWTNSLLDQGLIADPKTYQHGEEAPDKLVLHLVPFSQGMLYVGSTDKLKEDQIELVHTLSDSFSVAYARYEDFQQLEEAKKRVEGTLSELRSAQDQLVHSEKMASLGELTAGIAHEIQNPLNFVNNFSDINKELAEELIEEIQNGNKQEAEAIIADIINNEDKIHHHGKRAEEIVRSMLLHSRGSTGEKELTDINVLADEYMRLSYHGMRAKDKSFNADFKLDLEEGLPKLKVVQQDIGRVLLNLINNAFYATNEKSRKKDNGEAYQPTVTLTTKKIKDSVEISLKDNGSGIPKNVLDKIFQPFFSTKPTGQGTGLGLSLSFDIITKGHGGTIDVNSKAGKGTEFIITLPVE